MNSRISETGFWSGDKAHQHHVHCPVLADWLANYFADKNKPLYDFGCGLGNYCLNFNKHGFTNVTGYEGDPPINKAFTNIVQQDLSKPFQVPVKGNVLFLEVAEHVPAQFEEQLVTNVVNACEENLILSWAIIGQDGFGHVNCKSNEYVINKFEALGFKHLEDKTKEVRSLDLSQAPWFYNTMFVFKRN